MESNTKEWIVVIDGYTSQVMSVYLSAHAPSESLRADYWKYTVEADYAQEAEYRALSLYYENRAKRTKTIEDTTNHALPRSDAKAF